MNGDVLAAAIKVAIGEALVAHPTASQAQTDAVWSKIAHAIVLHVQGATVTIALGSTANGVTVGAATVPVTGSAVIS